MANVVEALISTDDSFSSTIEVKGAFNFSLTTNAFVGTVTLQRRFKEETWRDINSFTSDFEGWDEQPKGATFRAGIKLGDYTSGLAFVRISN